MKLIIDIDEEWYSYIIASKDHIDEDDEAYLILNGVPYEERPQGEWVKIGDIGLAYTCNKCGEVNVIPTNFCPNCGAKMKGGAE